MTTVVSECNPELLDDQPHVESHHLCGKSCVMLLVINGNDILGLRAKISNYKSSIYTTLGPGTKRRIN